MKTIILSIKPCYVEEIIAGRKTVELRKRIGTLFSEGEKIYIYSSSPIKALVATANISYIKAIRPDEAKKKYLDEACITSEDYDVYFNGANLAYLIFIDNVALLDETIPLVELRMLGITPPQSFCYIDDSIFGVGRS